MGAALQQRGALETPAAEGDPRFLVQILGEPVWLIGAALQGCGWILQAIALERGSLIVVQSLCTLSLVFALPLGARLTAQHIGRRSIVGAGCTVIGIVTFLAVGQPHGGASEPDEIALVTWVIIGTAAMLGVALVARRRKGSWRPPHSRPPPGSVSACRPRRPRCSSGNSVVATGRS
ncbi:MAG: DMT family transporter [Candidatus Limnocylindrales bacterium]